MSAAVHRAIKDWVCLTGINWFVKDTVMKQGSSVDSTSLIYLNDFSGGDIIAKFEGNNSERCFDGSDFFAYHKELDIRISRDFTNNNKIDDWFYDLTRLKPVPNREIDFYAVITHELGHAFNLGHLIEKDICIGQIVLASWARQKGYNGIIAPGARGAKNYENIILFNQSYIDDVVKEIIPQKIIKQ